MKTQSNNAGSTYFKVLSFQNEPIDGSKENWSLPQGTRNGKVTLFDQNKALYCQDGLWKELAGVKGTWLVTNPKLFYPLNSGRRIYVAQILEDPSCSREGMIWTTKTRLLREATNLDLKRFGIYRAFVQLL